MSQEIEEPKALVLPDEVENPEGGSHYEKYKKDGVYEYSILPNGKKDKTRITIKYNTGAVYEGSLRRGKCHGDGRYAWKDGGYYIGKFQKGKLSGAGEYHSTNGDTYTGNFKNNKYEGNGKYTWADGSNFEGSFKNGQLLSGRYTDASGNVYFCSYTYKRNGERAHGSVKLLQVTSKSTAPQAKIQQEEHKEKITQKERLEKNGLLNRDATLMTAIRKSVRGGEFKSLYSGAAGKNEENDKRLMSILNFFTNSNAEQMQRIYQSSKLFDEGKGVGYVEKLTQNVIQGSLDFTKQLRERGKERQNSASAAKGAAR